MSFRLVKEVRKILNEKKVGHTGTLDPFAEGVIVICTGKDTKKSDQIMNLKKEYICTIELGKITDTDDITGKIIKESDIGNYSRDQIEEILKDFTGEIYQVPPKFSAKKIDGVRAYKLARSGIEIKLKPRKVIIYSIELLELKPDIMRIKVECSKGTYMRSLARDVGEKLGCGGYLKSLVRTRIGDFNIENSLKLEDLPEALEKISN